MSYLTCNSPSTLAGSKYLSSPISKRSGSPSLVHFAHRISQLQKSDDNNVTPSLDRFFFRPRFWSSADNIPGVGAYNSPFLQSALPFWDQTTATVPVFNIEKFHSFYLESCETPVTEDYGSQTVASFPSFTLSFEHHSQPQRSPLLPAPLFIGEDPSESSPIIRPKLEESENLFLDIVNPAISLSPYAPMPLPPIFIHESGSKVAPIPIDIASASRDPALGLSPRCQTPDSSFARGSTVSERLWPPSPSAPPPVLEVSAGPETPKAVTDGRHLIYPEVDQEILAQLYNLKGPSPPASHRRCPIISECLSGIPLEVATSHAAAIRAAGENVSLSLPFLMQFLGQPTGQSKWHCYIRGCGKQLTRKGHMVDHVRMHLDERSFACHHCSQTFLRKADCKRHAATHNPTKGFSCCLCPKSYARRDLLTRHIRICQRKFGEDDERYTGEYLQKKRKRSHLSKSASSRQVTPEMASDLDILLMPREGYKNNEGFQYWEYCEGNKENINPVV